ncbi:hypothetical protein M011DRAFT_370773, partial [Sporormia fimetaria CBS 119925]
MKFSLFAIIALAGFTAAAPAAAPDAAPLEIRETKAAATNRLMKASMTTFQKARGKKSPSSLIWTSDGCTDSPDNPFGFKFLKSCQRHDFGYRNYKKQGRFTKQAKIYIDNRFRTDMRNWCASAQLNVPKRTACNKLADTYWAFVKKYGKRDLGAD